MDATTSYASPAPANLVADLERAERRASDMRFSSKLRAEAFQRAESIRRRLAA